MSITIAAVSNSLRGFVYCLQANKYVIDSNIDLHFYIWLNLSHMSPKYFFCIAAVRPIQYIHLL